jgi:hypothetical protein
LPCNVFFGAFIGILFDTASSAAGTYVCLLPKRWEKISWTTRGLRHHRWRTEVRCHEGNVKCRVKGARPASRGGRYKFNSNIKFKTNANSCLDFFCAGQQALDERGPFGVEGGALEVAAGAVVPVIGVGGGAFLAMQVGVNGHAVRGFQFVNQAVGLCPIAFGIPPEGSERSGKGLARDWLGEGCREFLGVHFALPCFADLAAAAGSAGAGGSGDISIVNRRSVMSSG